MRMWRWEKEEDAERKRIWDLINRERVESEGEREESRDMVNLVSGRGGMRQRK